MGDATTQLGISGAAAQSHGALLNLMLAVPCDTTTAVLGESRADVTRSQCLSADRGLGSADDGYEHRHRYHRVSRAGCCVGALDLLPLMRPSARCAG